MQVSSASFSYKFLERVSSLSVDAVNRSDDDDDDDDDDWIKNNFENNVNFWTSGSTNILRVFFVGLLSGGQRKMRQCAIGVVDENNTAGCCSRALALRSQQHSHASKDDCANSLPKVGRSELFCPISTESGRASIALSSSFLGVGDHGFTHGACNRTRNVLHNQSLIRHRL